MMNEAKNSMKPDYTFKNYKDFFVFFLGFTVDEKFIKSCTIWVDWLKGRNSVSWFGIIINSEFSFSIQLTAEKVDIENGKALLKTSFNPEFYIRAMRPSESELTEKMANLYKFYDRVSPFLDNKLFYFEDTEYLIHYFEHSM